MQHHRLLGSFMAALGLGGLLALAGCQGGVGSINTGGDSTGSLLSSDNGTLAVATSSYLVLDLDAGTYTTRTDLPEIASDTAYQGRLMAFKRVSGNGADYFVGTAEVTQGQWSRLVQSTDSAALKAPWTSVLDLVSAAGSPAQGSAMPAFNMSYVDAAAVVNGYNSRKGTKLGFPTAAQWRFACSAGSAGTYSWGDASDRTTVAPRAAVAPTQDGVKGPRSAYGRLPNAFGLYDMHGNVWEWTAGGTAALGGSWYDGLALARISNQLGAAEGVVDTEGHPLIGLRLIIQP